MEWHLERQLNAMPHEMRTAFLRQMGAIPPLHCRNPDCTVCSVDHLTVGVSVRPAEAGIFKVQFTFKE
jgi:hypothetical protein